MLDDGEIGGGPHVVTRDRSLPRDRRIDQVEEAQVFAEAADDPHGRDRVVAVRVVERGVETVADQRGHGTLDQARVGVRDAQDASVIAAAGVIDAREQADFPVGIGCVGPVGEVSEPGRRRGGEGDHRLAARGVMPIVELARLDAAHLQVAAGAVERLDIDESGAEPLWPGVDVAAHDAAEVTTAVAIGLLRRRRHVTDAEQTRSDRQMRALARAVVIV